MFNFGKVIELIGAVEHRLGAEPRSVVRYFEAAATPSMAPGRTHQWPSCGAASRHGRAFAAQTEVTGMEPKIKVYCDTNTLPGNADACETESKATEQLSSNERLIWFTSYIVRYEAMNTKG